MCRSVVRARLDGMLIGAQNARMAHLYLGDDRVGDDRVRTPRTLWEQAWRYARLNRSRSEAHSETRSTLYETLPFAWRVLAEQRLRRRSAADFLPVPLTIAGRCVICGDFLRTEGEVREGPDGEDYCESCFDDQFATCTDCDTIGSQDTMTNVNGDRWVCEDCARHYSECEDCGILTHDDALNHLDSGGAVCRDCAEHYFTCDRCECELHEDSYHSNGICNECAEHEAEENEPDPDGELIGPYGSHPGHRLPRHGNPKDRLWYGVELEVQVSERYDLHERAELVLDRLGSDFAALTSDSSIGRGFEIVTAPATIDHHRDRWQRLLGKGTPDGLRSWGTDRCGLHVHASRTGLTPLTIGKLLKFWNDPTNQDKLLTKLCGRPPGAFCNRTDKEISDAHPTTVKGKIKNRYEVVNTTPDKTIEFRQFRGNAAANGPIRAVETTDATIRFCQQAGTCELTTDAFVRFVALTPKRWPELSRWLRANGRLQSTRPARELVTTES